MPNDGDKLKQKQEQGKNAMRNQALAKGAEVAATAFAGPAGGKAVKALSKTQLGKNVLNKAGNNLENKMGNQFGGNKNGSNQSNPLSNLNPMNRMLKGGGLGLAGGLLGQKKEEKSTEENVEEGESSQTQEEQAPSAQIASTLKKYGKIALPFIGVGGVGCLLMGIATIVVIIYLLSPLFAIDQLINNVSEKLSNVFGQFFENVGNMSKCGYMDDEKCDAKLEDDFYSKVKDVSDDFYKQYKIKINSALLVATLTYYDMENSTIEEDSNVSADVDSGNITATNDEGQLKSNYIDFKKSTKKIKLLATQMIGDAKKQEIQENVYGADGKQEFESDGTTPKTKTTTKITYSLDLDKYRKYLEDDFIRTFYFDGSTETGISGKVNQAVDDIYNREALYRYLMYDTSDSNYSGVSNISVEVYNCAGTILLETVPLKDYVRGILTVEAGLNYTYDNPEFLKVMAIAGKNWLFVHNGVSVDSLPTSLKVSSCQMNQIYCSVEKGCHVMNDGTNQYNPTVTSGPDENGNYRNPPITDEAKLTLINDIVDETFSTFLVDENNKLVSTQYRASCTMTCDPTTNIMDQAIAIKMGKSGSSYQEIIATFYSGTLTKVNIFSKGYVVESQFVNITSTFGWRVHPRDNVCKYHTGIDIASDGIEGTEIYAAEDGTVTQVSGGCTVADQTCGGGYGNSVVIGHGSNENGDYALYTLYGHMKETPKVSMGDTVEAGEVIGYVGTTGKSTGPHLHFEVFTISNGVEVRQNPIEYLSNVEFTISANGNEFSDCSSCFSSSSCQSNATCKANVCSN